MMEPYQHRVIRERDELHKKVDKLTLFKDSEAFENLEAVDRNLLQEQWMAMIDYLDILNLRIERFNRKEAVNATTH